MDRKVRSSKGGFRVPASIPINVPDGEAGDHRVETFEITKQEAAIANIRAMAHPLESVQPGTYKRLLHGDDVVMSNTPMEIETNSEFIRRAEGRVLINGLGLGMCLAAILEKPVVTEVWIIEKHESVIQLVAPTYADDPRVKIIHADAMTYQPPADISFDVVWHDIWTDISADNLEEMDLLMARYRHSCEWQGCWSYNEIQERTVRLYS